jgi:hypothetical protein
VKDNNEKLFQKAIKLVTECTTASAVRRRIDKQLRATVKRYRSRYNEKHTTNTRALRDNFLQAAEILELVRNNLKDLDDGHTKLFWDVPEENAQ